MLKTLEQVFDSQIIQNAKGQKFKLHSHTSKDQGLFLQKIFEEIKPSRSLEIGLAYGISALFILEKYKEANGKSHSHIIIEPMPGEWMGVAEFNIEKEGLTYLSDIRYSASHDILPELYLNKVNIQFAYVDTTKVFDNVLMDFYFIDLILDVGGVIIFDDCGFPGVQKVVRFITSLPHYNVYGKFEKIHWSKKRIIIKKLVSFLISCIPFKNKVYPNLNFSTDIELGLDYACIAFQKISTNKRDMAWDKKF